MKIRIGRRRSGESKVNGRKKASHKGAKEKNGCRILLFAALRLCVSRFSSVVLAETISTDFQDFRRLRNDGLWPIEESVLIRLICGLKRTV
jgi:hypothetical protein